MKKYNLSQIMKNAWRMVKTAGMTISAALRKAWAMAKGEIKMTKDYTWTTPRGAKVAMTITIEHITSREINDEAGQMTVKCNHWHREITALTVNGKATAAKRLDYYNGVDCIFVGKQGKNSLYIAIPDAIVDEIYGEERAAAKAKAEKAAKLDKWYEDHCAMMRKAMSN